MVFCRGLKDPEGAKRRMETKAAAAAEMEGGGGGMKWQVNWLQPSSCVNPVNEDLPRQSCPMYIYDDTHYPFLNQVII